MSGIGDRRQKGYRTGQVKGKDYIYSTGLAGMGGTQPPPLANFRYLFWAIRANRLAMLNTKLGVFNDNFVVLDFYPTPLNPNAAECNYRLMFATRPPVNDVVDYSSVKYNVLVLANTGKGRLYLRNELDLPQPTDVGYDGNIYVIIDMLQGGRAPMGDVAIANSEFEAMLTKIYDYEARL